MDVTRNARRPPARRTPSPSRGSAPAPGATVAILQEYVPAYRARLFEEMRALAADADIRLVVAAGRPQGEQALRGDTSAFAPDVDVKETEWSVLGRRVSWRRVADVYRDADLVIAEQARRNIDVHLALRDPRRTVALWGHGADHTHATSARDAQMLARLTRRAHWFFGYTPASIDRVTAGGYPRERTTTLYNSTDTAALRRALDAVTPEAAAGLRTRLRLDGDIALFVGALDRSKRLDFLLAAADAARAAHPALHLVIAGDGPDRAMLEHAARTRPWLHVLGRAEGGRLATLLSVADVMVMPGRVGLVAVDALVAEVPVITTDWPFHAPERAYLTPDNSVTTADTVEDYARGIVHLLTHPQERAALAAASRATAHELSIERMAARFVGGITDALAA